MNILIVHQYFLGKNDAGGSRCSQRPESRQPEARSSVAPTRRFEPCASALREGVPFAIHSDAGVTPLGQLHTMWCAVNRLTPKGRVLGEAEQISPYEALRAVTINAAYQLHLDHEIGSLEAGKRADFAVLEEDPLSVDPMTIRDIAVWGTVLGGQPYPAGGA